ACPWACSGLMYWGVPIVTPGCVRWIPSASWSRQRPKSATLTCPLRVSSRFSGLMSRWMRPSSPAAPMATPVCLRIESARGRQGDVEGPLLHQELAEVRPLDIFHGNEAHVLNVAEHIHMDDVRVIQAGDGGGLGLEPAEVERVVEHLGAEHLERHRPVQADLA